MNVRLDQQGVLQIEPTDRCNLACAMCQPHRDRPERVHGRAPGFMEPALLERILDGLIADDCHFDHVILQWMGEPTLHPHIAVMAGLVARRLQGRARYLRIDTNGLPLAPERGRALVEAWLPSSDLPLLLVFSIDAATRPTYTRLKGCDGLEKVRRNLRAIVAERRRLGAVGLSFQVQMVVQPGNETEVASFVSWWGAFFACHAGGGFHDEILLKRLSVGAGGEGQAAADRLYDAAIREAGLRGRAGGPLDLVLWEDRPWEHDDSPHEVPRQPCPGLWMTPVIRNDGVLLPCCVDLLGEMALGSLAHEGFRQIWEGPAMTARRLDHVRGRFTGPCAACGGINWYRMPPEVVREWLERVGRAELWGDYAGRMGGG